MSWEFSVLGPLDCRSTHGSIRLTRPMSRTLLALLLVRSNACVPVDQLIDELWQGSPPSSAEGALRVHIAHLREALGSGGSERESPIQFDNGGYCLTVSPGWFDVERFEAAVRDGRVAMQQGAPEEAADLLGGALRLWRGTPYDEFHHIGAVHGEAVRLSELRLGAVETLADAHLAIDRPGSACELLIPESRSHPLRETIAERLMLALYRSGRSAEALGVASRLRQALDDDLGVLPGAAVRDLEDGIVMQSPDLDPPRRRTLPDPDVVTRYAPFVGRRVEARALDEAWERARAGTANLALICGGVGIGKTALADQLAQRAKREDASVLVGHCDPDPHADYEPFPHLVRQAIARVPAEALDHSVFGELRRLVPDLGDQLPALPEPATASAGRHRLFAAVNRLLEACPTPLLLQVEDLHWAQSDALAMLRHVVRECEGPILIVATYRDEEADADSPLGRALATGRLAEPDVRIRLHGLDVPELKALLQMLGADRGRDIAVAELWELTSGNPLFVREVVRELGDAASERPLNDLAPDGVRTLVEHQLQGLSLPARETLTTAALLGSRFLLPLLAATGRMSETDALSGLDEALAARLVEETDELDWFTFNHPLVRNVIYASIPASRRARLHLRAGQILAVATKDGRWSEPARHFLAALPLGDPQQTARYARRAGDEASERFAHEDAAEWYRAALGVPEGTVDEGERSEVLLALGLALERGGDRGGARVRYLDAAAAARTAGNACLLADVAIAATPRYVTVDDFHVAHRALVDQALAGQTDERRRVKLLSCASASRYYDDGGEADRPYVVQALDLARQSATPEVRATGLRTYHRWLTHDPNAAEERTGLSQELVDLCTDESLHDALGVACRDLLVNLLSVGRFAEFDRELVHLDSIASAHDVPADRYWASALRATRGLTRASDAETEGLVRAARTLGSHLQLADSEGTFILQMFALRCQQGRAREITRGLEAPSRDQPRMESGLALLASAFVESDRDDDARRILDQVVADDTIRLPKDNMWLAATALLGGVAARVGTAAQRAVCARELDGLDDQWCVFGAGGAVFGPVQHWLGVMAAADGATARARDCLEQARDRSVVAGAQHWVGRADAELARIRVDPGSATGRRHDAAEGAYGRE